MAELVKDLVDLLDDDREGRYAVSKVVQRRIVPPLQHDIAAVVLVGQLLAAIEKLHQTVYGLQRAAQVKEVALFHPRVL